VKRLSLVEGKEANSGVRASEIVSLEPIDKAEGTEEGTGITEREGRLTLVRRTDSGRVWVAFKTSVDTLTAGLGT